MSDAMFPALAPPLSDEHERVADVTIYRGPDGLYGCAEFIANDIPTGKDAKSLHFAVARLLDAAAVGTRAFARGITFSIVEHRADAQETDGR